MANARKDTGSEWLRLHEDAELEAGEAMECIQERSELAKRGVDAARLAAVARRKLGALQKKIDALNRTVEEGGKATDQEVQRRKQLVAVLNAKRANMTDLLGQAGKKATSGDPRPQGAPRETERTANLETGEILQLQDTIMRDQDGNIESMSRDVSGIKHVALTINDELSLHQRLLEDLDEDLDYTHRNVKTLQKRIAYIMKRSGGFKTMCFLILLIVGLVFLLIFVVRIT
eukprot:jgi/Pico_ML_1/52820/g3470.t1